jgi:uncharacterized protein with FMN-binding domain
VVNGKITEAWAAQYPQASNSQDGTSIRTNAKAIPLLRTETLKAQSSAIANVTNATYTSNAWKASLQSAMTAAGL